MLCYPKRGAEVEEDGLLYVLQQRQLQLLSGIQKFPKFIGTVRSLCFASCKVGEGGWYLDSWYVFKEEGRNWMMQSCCLCLDKPVSTINVNTIINTFIQSLTKVDAQIRLNPLTNTITSHSHSDLLLAKCVSVLGTNDELHNTPLPHPLRNSFRSSPSLGQRNQRWSSTTKLTLLYISGEGMNEQTCVFCVWRRIRIRTTADPPRYLVVVVKKLCGWALSFWGGGGLDALWQRERTVFAIINPVDGFRADLWTLKRYAQSPQSRRNKHIGHTE